MAKRKTFDHELELRAIKVEFAGGKVGRGKAEGNNATWTCTCGEALLGRCYYQFGDTCYTTLAYVRPDGHRDLFVQVEGVVARVSAGLVGVTITDQDGTTREFRPSDPAPFWLKRALNDAVVARALRLRDGPDLSWSDLYRLYEVVRDALGGDDRIASA
jgi:hypothetical protein